tara:strand:+ start:1324 stop:1509 length:186 start_codon:yes stop_codon:yes gene_type:complete
MRYIKIIFFLLLLTGCSSYLSNTNKTSLQLDIYENGMTFEKFKQKVMDYANNAPYPSLSNK